MKNLIIAILMAFTCIFADERIEMYEGSAGYGLNTYGYAQKYGGRDFRITDDHKYMIVNSTENDGGEGAVQQRRKSYLSIISLTNFNEFSSYGSGKCIVFLADTNVFGHGSVDAGSELQIVDLKGDTLYLLIHYVYLSGGVNVVGGDGSGLLRLSLRGLIENPLIIRRGDNLKTAIYNRNLISSKTHVSDLGRVSVASAYPNPANPSTSILYSAPGGASAEMAIYSISGKIVRTFNGLSGNGRVIWDGRDMGGIPVGSGQYTYVYSANGDIRSGKVTILK